MTILSTMRAFNSTCTFARNVAWLGRKMNSGSRAELAMIRKMEYTPLQAHTINAASANANHNDIGYVIEATTGCMFAPLVKDDRINVKTEFRAQTGLMTYSEAEEWMNRFQSSNNRPIEEHKDRTGIAITLILAVFFAVFWALTHLGA